MSDRYFPFLPEPDELDPPREGAGADRGEEAGDDRGVETEGEDRGAETDGDERGAETDGADRGAGFDGLDSIRGCGLSTRGDERITGASAAFGLDSIRGEGLSTRGRDSTLGGSDRVPPSTIFGRPSLPGRSLARGGSGRAAGLGSLRGPVTDVPVSIRGRLGSGLAPAAGAVPAPSRGFAS